MKQSWLILALLVASSCAEAAVGSYKPVIIAHRGASGYLPEHTLPALAMAHAFDVDYLEADVVLTKDNIPVVMHDHSLNTSTDVAIKYPNRKRADGGYYVIDFTLAEIKTLVVHERRQDDMSTVVFPNRFPSVDTISDFRVPTLEEFILTVQGMNKSRGRNIGIYPEIKEPAFHEREGKDAVKIVIDMLTKYGYNKPDGGATLQYFDYDAVKKTRELGWQGNLAMLVDAEGQALTDDTAIHAWLMTEEGIADVSQYANYYAPWLGHLVEEDSSSKGYKATPLTALARKYNMKLTTWTHRADATVGPLKSSEAVLDAVFKDLKLDELFSDHADVAIDYLIKNKMR
ncbi:MAG: glycerophosphodiester phosphodiesterase [Brevinema sp.]